MSHPIHIEKAKLYPVDGIIQGLLNLRELLPGEDSRVYSFAEYLARGLQRRGSKTILDLGLQNAYFNAIRCLRFGVPYRGVPCPQELVGLPEQAYSALERKLMDVARSVCPSELVAGLESDKPIAILRIPRWRIKQWLKAKQS